MKRLIRKGQGGLAFAPVLPIIGEGLIHLLGLGALGGGAYAASQIAQSEAPVIDLSEVYDGAKNAIKNAAIMTTSAPLARMWANKLARDERLALEQLSVDKALASIMGQTNALDDSFYLADTALAAPGSTTSQAGTNTSQAGTNTSQAGAAAGGLAPDPNQNNNLKPPKNPKKKPNLWEKFKKAYKWKERNKRIGKMFNSGAKGFFRGLGALGLYGLDAYIASNIGTGAYGIFTGNYAPFTSTSTLWGTLGGPEYDIKQERRRAEYNYKKAKSDLDIANINYNKKVILEGEEGALTELTKLLEALKNFDAAAVAYILANNPRAGLDSINSSVVVDPTTGLVVVDPSYNTTTVTDPLLLKRLQLNAIHQRLDPMWNYDDSVPLWNPTIIDGLVIPGSWRGTYNGAYGTTVIPLDSLSTGWVIDPRDRNFIPYGN